MPSKYKPGDIAYIVENGMTVREVKVKKATGDFLTLQFMKTRGRFFCLALACNMY